MATPILNLRVDDPTKERWQAAARDAGYSLSEWMKATLNDACSPDRPKTRAQKKAEADAPKVRTVRCPHRLLPDQFCRECDA